MHEREPEQSLIGCQLTLIQPPARQPLPAAEWKQIELTKRTRAHQSYSAELRQNARDFYRHVFEDRREHPPIA